MSITLSSTSIDEEETEMLEEARLLRQHKGRLETRMHILEGHNKQLESQLKKLKTLLDQVIMILIMILIKILIKILIMILIMILLLVICMTLL